MPACAILIPVRVLLVIWYVLINDNKVNNLVGKFWVFSLGFCSFYGANLLLVQCYTIILLLLSAAADMLMKCNGIYHIL